MADQVEAVDLVEAEEEVGQVLRTLALEEVVGEVDLKVQMKNDQVVVEDAFD